MLMHAGNINAQDTQRSQGPPQMDPEEMARKQTEWITKELALDKTTSDKVYQIELKMFNAMKDQVEKNRGGDRETMRAGMDKIRETRNTELKALLGAENFAKIEKKEAEMRPQGPPRGEPQKR